MELDKVTELSGKLVNNISTVLFGKPEQTKLAVAALLARGHILIEDRPGVGKTMLAKALSKSVGMNYRRVQFTADLLPADITGSYIYDQKNSEFIFTPGAIFANIVLADEINRSSPRTQSALFEAMEEGQVSLEGNTHILPDPHMIIATLNPEEEHGVYPLPLSQLDRFLVSFSLGYPDADVEKEIIKGQLISHPLEKLTSIADAGLITGMQEAVKSVHVSDALTVYVVDLLTLTRKNGKYPAVSPRAGLGISRMAQALAIMDGRDYATPDDIKTAARNVIPHRFKRYYQYAEEKDLVEELLFEVKSPL